MTEITMPKLSDTMTEGRFGVWKKSVGERVERGEVIAEVETDKAVMELEAFASGVLLETRIKSGELVTVGTVIGVIGAVGEVVADLPVPPMAAVEQSPLPITATVSETFVPPLARPESPSMTFSEEHRDGRAAPTVRRHARELGIDLALVPGSGPGGRVLMADLERYMRGDVPAGSELVSGEERGGVTENSLLPVSPPVVSGESVSLSPMRATIARTVTESWRTIPHFSVAVDVTMDAADEIRRELKLAGSGVSVNDFILKAAALALRKYPRVNSSFSTDRIIAHDEVNIGMAVSIPDGLLVPVVRRCDTLPLREIAVETRRLVSAARSGRLSESELTGGTFTVSNLGMYGITSFTAVILPSQSAILAVGAVRHAVVPRNGMPFTEQHMTITLSADHRLLDGVAAAEFLNQIRTLLETPVLLLV